MLAVEQFATFLFIVDRKSVLSDALLQTNLELEPSFNVNRRIEVCLSMKIIIYIKNLTGAFYWRKLY